MNNAMPTREQMPEERDFKAGWDAALRPCTLENCPHWRHYGHQADAVITLFPASTAEDAALLRRIAAERGRGSLNLRYSVTDRTRLYRMADAIDGGAQ